LEKAKAFPHSISEIFLTFPHVKFWTSPLKTKLFTKLSKNPKALLQLQLTFIIFTLILRERQKEFSESKVSQKRRSQKSPSSFRKGKKKK
jgi:hypothetical protein